MSGNTVTRNRPVDVQRCEAKTRPTWYRPEGGRCPYAAKIKVNNRWLCQKHADLATPTTPDRR